MDGFTVRRVARCSDGTSHWPCVSSSEWPVGIACSGGWLTPPIKYHGGKHYLAKRIVALMPPHIHYVEPYFGGGAVLLYKDPYGVSEVVNDIHSELMTFWRVLQHEHLFAKMKRVLDVVPFSFEEFDSAQFVENVRALIARDSDAPLEPAVLTAINFFIRARQSRQGKMNDFATLSRNRTRRGMNEQVSSWLTAIEGLPEVHARMKRVVMLKGDAIRVIEQQDGPRTLFYCDPPYLHETRVTTEDYSFEMTADDHRKLLYTLAQIKGAFILSGYPSSMYAVAQRTHGWHRETILIDNKASSSKVKAIKTECLWMNFQPSIAQLAMSEGY